MKVRADEIKNALSKRHTEDLFMTEVKTGKTWGNDELLKFDAYAIKKSWANPCLTGYEIKVTRQDFLNDNKWPGYMPSCNKFSFVCPKGLIALEELADEVGLIWYYPDTGALVSKRPAKHRIIERPENLFYYVLLSRLDSDRHPFFSDQRDFWQSYIAEKENKRILSFSVKNKLISDVEALSKQVDELKTEAKTNKTELERYELIKDVLKQSGIDTDYWYRWQEELETRLQNGIPKGAVRIVANLKRIVGELEGMFPNKSEIKP